VRHELGLPLVLVLLSALGCGGSAPPAEEAPAPSAAPAADATAAPADDAKAAAADVKIPEGCEGSASECVMPREFVKRLCAKAYPDLALYFFRKGSPWRRAYVGVKDVAPFNGLSGPSSEEKLVFDEELIVLSEKKAATGGMQVSGASGSTFDLLRWDGTCATMNASELRFDSPPKPKHAPVVYRFLEDATQAVLEKDEKFATAVLTRKKECKGATMGNVSLKCEQADKKLNDMMIDVVRGGAAVPQPGKHP
jgi:hypothetical protein